MSLFDEFMAIVNSAPDGFPAKCEPCPAFADLLWGRPLPRVEDLIADPGPAARTKLRQVAFLRAWGEIRYFLGMAPEIDDRRATEMGVVRSVEDAVGLAREFLLGCIPGEIDIPRTAYSDRTTWRMERSHRIDSLRPMLDALTEGSAEPIDVPGDVDRPWLRVYVYRDLPETGVMTVFTLGASSGSCIEWGVDRPECVMTLRALDSMWALGLARVIQRHAHRSSLAAGEVLDLGESLAAPSEMRAIRLEPPKVYEPARLRFELPDRCISFMQAYPLCRRELALLYDTRPIGILCAEVGADPSGITRAPLPLGVNGSLTTDECEIQYLLDRIDQFWIRLMTHTITLRTAEIEAWETWTQLTSPELLDALRVRRGRTSAMNPCAARCHEAAFMECESRTRRKDGSIRATRAEVLRALRDMTLGDGYPREPIL